MSTRQHGALRGIVLYLLSIAVFTEACALRQVGEGRPGHPIFRAARRAGGAAGGGL